jgi:hypothetical protein
MRTHELKTWPEPFQAVWDNKKHHEVRIDDRGYMVGDILVLREYDPSSASSTVSVPRGFTGRVIRVGISYVSQAGTWGLPPNLCVLSIYTLNRETP